MTPTIVLKDGKAPVGGGDPRRFAHHHTVLEILVNVIDHGMSLKKPLTRPAFTINGCPTPWPPSRSHCRPIRRGAGAHGLPHRALEVWGAGNAAEAVGVARPIPPLPSRSGFPRPGMLYGASDARAPAGAAVSP